MSAYLSSEWPAGVPLAGFTVGSLFSGIGGIDLAAHWAGFSTSWFVEREPFCQKVLAKHWPNTPIHNDVFECHDLPHVSLVVGGFPCQPFSVAGKRQGANDERYLLPEMLRIVSEVKPYAVLFENVPGFPSLNDGAEFKYLLGALAESGFDAEWGHIRASDIGAPHQRERWFCVAYARSIRGWHNARRQETGAQIITGSIANVADPTGIRRERHTAGQGQNRFQQGRASQLARGNQTELGYTSGTGLQRRAITRNVRGIWANRKQFIARPSTGAIGGQPQPGVRRVVDGLSAGVDRNRGVKQHALSTQNISDYLLPNVRKAVRTSGFQGRPTGKLRQLRKAKVLHSKVCGDGSVETTSPTNQQLLPLPQAGGGTLPNVRHNRPFASPPHRRESEQQRFIEPYDIVYQLPHEMALRAWGQSMEKAIGLLNLWKAISRIEPVQQTLFAIKAKWDTLPEWKRRWVINEATGQSNWPARPGMEQFPHEPPRVTVGKVQDRAARLKALGNAVVPYQVYPILASIHEWLTGLAESEAA